MFGSFKQDRASVSKMDQSLSKDVDRFLNALDKAPISDSAVFKRKKDKERYESILSFALSNYHSAIYHLRNIEGFIEQEEAVLEDYASISKEKLKVFLDEMETTGEFRISMYRSANEYGYELSSFLVDIKTALDFLATMGSFHLKGVSADSIKTLIRLVEKGKESHLLSVISNWLEWLIAIRDYRHKLVHRLVLKPDSGFFVRQIIEKSVKCRYPVVIPKKTPSFVYDTRLSRLSKLHRDNETLKGLMVESGEAWASLENGSKVLLNSKTNVVPAPGFIAIEVFMKTHLDNFKSFLIEFLQKLKDFDLEIISS